MERESGGAGGDTSGEWGDGAGAGCQCSACGWCEVVHRVLGEVGAPQPAHDVQKVSIGDAGDPAPDRREQNLIIGLTGDLTL